MLKGLVAVTPDAYATGLEGWTRAPVAALREAVRSVKA